MTRIHLIYAPILGLLAGALVASNACAEERTRKPTVCENFVETTVADKAAPTGQRKIGICYDSKRPRVFTNWAYVTVDGKRYAVGS